jgi:hypothetical protein
MTVIDGLKRAIAALNMKPNFRLSDGTKSYDLLEQLDKITRDRQAATRYEARIVDATGGYYILNNEEGEPIEGQDFDAVKDEALAMLEETHPRTIMHITNGKLNLVIAEVLTTYIKV